MAFKSVRVLAVVWHFLLGGTQQQQFTNYSNELTLILSTQYWGLWAPFAKWSFLPFHTHPLQRKDGEMFREVAGRVNHLMSEFVLWGTAITLGVVVTTKWYHSDLPSGKNLLPSFKECCWLTASSSQHLQDLFSGASSKWLSMVRRGGPGCFSQMGLS